MKCSFLASQNVLTKKYVLTCDGTITKTSYLNAYEVTSFEENVNTLSEFHAAITRHAALGHCLVKGELTRPLINESRAGSTNPNASSWWVCLDIDGLPSDKYNVSEILTLMGLGDFSHIIQWSASQGISDTNWHCHVMMLLAKPAAAPLLKQWLIQLNHRCKFLSENLKLTKTNMSLSWGLDITACQNDKLIYIAPPILEGIKSPLGRRPRYELIVKPITHLVLPDLINTPETNKLLTAAKIASLRAGAGLPTRKNTYRQYKDTEVLSKPDEATVTEVKHDRGFTYLNLNGGDSWAYWHPEDNCEIIYNFKGESNYATKELIPEYYKQAKSVTTNNSDAESSLGAYIDPKAAPDAPILLAFRDLETGVYYHGQYTSSINELQLAVARSEKQVRDFCMQHGMPMGDFVPIWQMVFEPKSESPRIDVESRKINMFSETEYMLNVSTHGAPKSKPRVIPKTIKKIMSHMLAGDFATIQHLTNWLAFIVQKRERPRTAWVWYGTEGTGKGMFASKILRPIFGMTQTCMRPGNVLASEYNAYMKNATLAFFDEAHVAEMKDSELIHGKLRNWITEPTISIRAMYSNTVEVANHAAIILMSNKPNVILLQKNDRRWNIAPYQDKKLELTDEEIDVLIPAELQAFYDYLYHYPLDEDAARTPLVSEDRDRLISTTTASADDVAHALHPKQADMGFLIDQLPSDGSNIGYKLGTSVSDYRKVLYTVIIRARNTAHQGEVKISRDELHGIFEYSVGNMPSSPNKFTKFLAHRHIHTEKVRIGDKTAYGISVKFKDFMHFEDFLKEHFKEENKSAAEEAKGKKK